MFDFSILSREDYETFLKFVGTYRDPDLIIAPEGAPYIYRWYVTPPKGDANVYFHVQVADDPERPLHNHPWDNTSVILSGGYRETLCLSQLEPTPDMTHVFIRLKGDVIFRRAGQSHRLEMLYGVPYTMTLFTTGPKVRTWGFWYPTGFVPFDQVTRIVEGQSVHIHPTM